MPDKTGRFTPQERVFVRQMASTGDPVYSAQKAGYSSPAQRASQALARPAVQAEITKLQLERLYSKVLPLAVEQHEKLLRDPATPAGAKVQAIKLAYDRTLGADSEAAHKEPHEMTAAELDAAIQRLRQAAAERAKPVIDVEPAPAEPRRGECVPPGLDGGAIEESDVFA